MQIIWLVPISIVSCFLYLIPVFKTTENLFRSPFTFFFILSIITSSISIFLINRKEFSSRKIYYLAIPVLMGCIFIPPPFNIGALLSLLGLCIHFVSFGNRALLSFAIGTFLTGMMFLVMSAVLPLFYVISSRYHEVKAINAVVWPLLKLLGVNASISENVLFFPFYEGLSAFPGTLEKIGHFFIFLFIPGGFLLLGLSGSSWRKYLIFSGITIIYIYLRYVFLLVLFSQLNRTHIFWNSAYYPLGFIPLAFILGYYMPIEKNEIIFFSKDNKSRFSLREWSAVFLFFLAALALTGAWGFNDPGNRKEGRVLIDEIHSDWEWSLKKFDKTWFGSQSTYNYYCMADYLNKFYHVDHNTDKKLYDDLLSNYDVLILKTPTQAFSTREIDAIERFVEKGGGLWMIGDHTNVFGMDYYLNFIAKRFSIFFHYDSTYDLFSGKLSYYKPPEIFPHPIVKDMSSFLFATSNTVQAPLTADNVMIGYGLKSRLLSYSGRAFFEKEPLQDYEFGLFLQSSAVRHGKGRVAVFTDSTCFSNFYMFIPGKPELALGTVEWLNRSNRFDFIPYMLISCAFLFFLFGIFLSELRKNEKILVIIFSAIPGFVLGVICFTLITEKFYPYPVNHSPLKKVYFESEHSDVLLPIQELVDKHKKSIHTFYVWTQRLDYVPIVKNRYLDCLDENSFVVIFNPVKPFSYDEIQKTEEFVRNGGKLLLIDGPQNSLSSSNLLLKGFGLSLNSKRIGRTKLFTGDNKELGVAINSGSVKGGQVQLKTSSGTPVFSTVKFGKGIVGVMSNSYIFLNPQIGGTQIKPSSIQQKIYHTEFYLFEMMEKLFENKR